MEPKGKVYKFIYGLLFINALASLGFAVLTIVQFIDKNEKEPVIFAVGSWIVTLFTLIYYLVNLNYENKKENKKENNEIERVFRRNEQEIEYLEYKIGDLKKQYDNKEWEIKELKKKYDIQEVDNEAQN